jgi:hypothetical protein
MAGAAAHINVAKAAAMATADKVFILYSCERLKPQQAKPGCGNVNIFYEPK